MSIHSQLENPYGIISACLQVPWWKMFIRVTIVRILQWDFAVTRAARSKMFTRQAHNIAANMTSPSAWRLVVLQNSSPVNQQVVSRTSPLQETRLSVARGLGRGMGKPYIHAVYCSCCGGLWEYRVSLWEDALHFRIADVIYSKVAFQWGVVLHWKIQRFFMCHVC